jgi:phosphate transport system substrate-binding protein
LKKLLSVLVAISLLSSLTFAKDQITVKGSDTMVILGQRWAEVYMKANPDVTIQVTGGGSGTGISALINGTTDICASSRPMKDAERDKLKEKFGSRGIEIKCALDGLAIYVHESSPIKELSLQQIKDIYTGQTTNWSEVGGQNAKIILYSRENNSGTYVYFKDEVLGGADFASSAQNMPGTAAVVNAVSKDKNGIGYGGSAYGKGIREIKVRKDEKSQSFAPTAENIKSGKYPVSRFLYMYTKTKPTGALKKYIDWTLSKDGQKIVSEVGYFPIR